jgi:hypothetical protein
MLHGGNRGRALHACLSQSARQSGITKRASQTRLLSYASVPGAEGARLFLSTLQVQSVPRHLEARVSS